MLRQPRGEDSKKVDLRSKRGFWRVSAMGRMEDGGLPRIIKEMLETLTNLLH